MATQTGGDLGLTKPNNGENVDGWDVPLNGNSDLIDTLVSYCYRSIVNAISAAKSDTTALNLATSVIGSADALKKYMDTLLTAEDLPNDLAFAKNDRFVGTQQAVFDVLAKLERYVYFLAQGNSDTDSLHPDRLSNEMARRHHYESNCVIGSNMTIGISSSKPVVQPTGAAPIEIDINGKTYQLHKATESASGALGASRGVAFVYAKPQEETVYSDGGSADGVFTKDGSIWRKFTSASVASFTDARAGHVLRISTKVIGNYDIAGDYIIESINAGEITIVGGIPVLATEASVTGLTFEVIDLFAVGIDHIFAAEAATAYSEINPQFTDVENKAFLGEIHWNGAGQDNIDVYSPKSYYDSGWLSVAALTSKPPTSPAVTGVISHNIGPVFNPTKLTTVWPALPKITVMVGVKDSNNFISDVQEVPFNSRFSGSGGVEDLERGWAGFCNRTYLQIAFGVRQKSGWTANYAVQRIMNEAAFLGNDPTLEASYITDPSDSYYRIIVSRR